MGANQSLVPELEHILQHGSPRRRAQALRRITTLFLDGASRFKEEHVRLFDEVFNLLIPQIDAKARAELSRRLAPIGNAPTLLVRELARDDDIEVARPVLQQSCRLAERDLLEIAASQSQAHLLAISRRPAIAESLAHVLVRRGDRAVVRSLARNPHARLCDASFTALLRSAEDDAALAEAIAMRSDVAGSVFRELLLKAATDVQQRLYALARPQLEAEIKRVLTRARGEVAGKSAPRDFRAAQRTVAALQEAGALNEAQLIDFAKARRCQEMVAALAALCRVPIEVVDRLIAGGRSDPILILCKAAGWNWPTARAIITARAPRGVNSREALDAAFANFERLTRATAARVIRFWQMRPRGTARRSSRA